MWKGGHVPPKPFRVAGVLFFCCLPLAAQQGPAQQSTTRGIVGIQGLGQRTYGISGRVLDTATGEGLEGAQVRLETFTGGYLQQVYVGPTGNFIFQDLRSGTYYVEASHPDYKRKRVSVQVVSTPVAGVFLHLRRKPPSFSPLFIEPIDVAEHLVPPEARKEYHQGIDRLKENDPQGALEHFGKAVEIYPEYASAWHAQGAVLFRLQRFGRARRSFEKAVEINPNVALPRILLGSTLNSLQRFRQAAPLLERAVKLDSDNWLGHFELARAYWGLKNLEEAEEESRRAHELNPQAPQVHLLRANVYLARRDYTGAVEEMDEFLKLFPEIPFAEKVRKKRTALVKLLKKEEANK